VWICPVATNAGIGFAYTGHSGFRPKYPFVPHRYSEKNLL
jgi:hypothetical protein